jgi:hypothetical protein
MQGIGRVRTIVLSGLLALPGLATLVAPGFAAESAGSLCARRGDDDRVRPIPQSLAAPAREALGLAEPDVELARATVYRCMGGVAWVCNHGANLSCAKANLARVSAGANAWCKANPGSSVVPAYVTGHDTIYSWTCAGATAIVSHAIPVDKRGFAADQWKPIGN